MILKGSNVNEKLEKELKQFIATLNVSALWECL